MKFNLKKLAGIIPVGISEAKKEQLTKEIAVGKQLQSLQLHEYWPVQKGIEDEMYATAISGLRKDSLTEKERIAYNAAAVTIENLRTARKALIKQGEIAEQTLLRLTGQKETDRGKH